MLNVPARADRRSLRVRVFPTRFDRFRAEAGIDLRRWYEALQMARPSFTRIRAGSDVSLETLARLVRAATALTGRAVKASELYDLGEDAPLGSPAPARPQRGGSDPLNNRAFYDTPLDRLLVCEGLRPSRVAAEARISRHGFQRIRAGLEVPRVSTLRALVAALRALTGNPVHAKDLYDLGEAKVLEDAAR